MQPSLYVHVPFCVVKCGYCDFNSFATADGTLHDRFLAALALELAARAPSSPRTVFVGGGTPTFLDEPRFARLLDVLTEHVDLAACDEVTLEANPESVTPAKAELARAAGVTRVSIGAQSFAAGRLRWLDRAHGAADIGRAFATFRAAGFENLSLDLMFGLPGQTLAEWGEDLEQALALGPDHLSCYNLTFERGTRLERDRVLGRVRPNDPAHDRELFVRTRERLEREGFEAYEISNFAGPGGPCRHNEHYWLQGDYVGVGPGAASHARGWRTTNLKPVETWCTALEGGLPATGEAETLTPEQRLGEALWLGLRRTAGVDLAALAERLGDDPRQRHGAAIAHWAEIGFLAVEGDRMRLTREGLLHADTVTASFL